MTDTTSALSTVDWSMNDNFAATSIDVLHPYPAKFVATLPYELLNRLRVPDGTSVMDPFVGSGTTMVQAQRMGYETLGIDLNPIACLMSRVKTSPTPKGIENLADNVLSHSSNLEPNLHFADSIPNVDHWFKSEVKLRLAQIAEAISHLDQTLVDVSELALSAIIVRVSNQDSDTRYAAVEKLVTAADVDTLFRKSVEKIASALKSRNYDLRKAHVIEADILSVELSDWNGKIGAVISSPPYPNAYEYWLYHKYRMFWLKRDPLAVKRSEIGARAHFFKKNRHTKETFCDQMAAVFQKIDVVLHRDGWIAMVVGRSKIHGEEVDNAQILQEAAKASGFLCSYQVNRPIKMSRKSFNLFHAKIASETVLVFERGL
jgi:site-specific DNA-methyltransferase (cytosine-N4-specific)